MMGRSPDAEPATPIPILPSIIPDHMSRYAPGLLSKVHSAGNRPADCSAGTSSFARTPPEATYLSVAEITVSKRARSARCSRSMAFIPRYAANASGGMRYRRTPPTACGSTLRFASNRVHCGVRASLASTTIAVIPEIGDESLELELGLRKIRRADQHVDHRPAPNLDWLQTCEPRRHPEIHSAVRLPHHRTFPAGRTAAAARYRRWSATVAKFHRGKMPAAARGWPRTTLNGFGISITRSQNLPTPLSIRPVRGSQSHSAKITASARKAYMTSRAGTALLISGNFSTSQPRHRQDRMSRDLQKRSEREDAADRRSSASRSFGVSSPR